MTVTEHALRNNEKAEGGAIRDLVTMTGRSVRLSLRAIDAVLLAVIMPVAMMLLFVFVFGGAMSTDGAYRDYVVPGVMLLCAGYGASLTAYSVQQDMSSGMIDRIRSLPMNTWTLLGGHVAASFVRSIISTILVLGVAVAIGFRPSGSWWGWLGAIGMILLFVMAVTWIAALGGVVARTPDAAGALSFFMLLLPYASSAFVPVETMPGWLRGFAGHQPITPAIESVRGFFDGAVDTGLVVLAVVWWTVIGLVFAVLAGFMFARAGRR